MTRQRYLELRPVMEAWVRGEAVQVKRFDSCEWSDCPDPEWHNNLQYRVKPRAQGEAWLVYDTPDDPSPAAWTDRSRAKDQRYQRLRAHPQCHIVHMREVDESSAPTSLASKPVLQLLKGDGKWYDYQYLNASFACACGRIYRSKPRVDSGGAA